MSPRQKDLDEANQDKNKMTKEDGKVKMDRSGCTDILCCIIFLAFLVVMVGLGFYGMKNGDPMNILTPFDTEGNRCGVPDQGRGGAVDFTDYPLKFFTKFGATNTTGWQKTPLSKKELFRSVCVKECPATIGAKAVCKSNSTCPNSFMETASQHHYCLPTSDSIIGAVEQLFAAMNENNNMGQYVADIQNCWQAIVGMCFGTILIAIIYTWALKIIVKPILYVSMVLILVGFILLGGFAWMKRAEYGESMPDGWADRGEGSILVWKDEKNYNYAQIGAIVGWAVAGLYACFMCCCWKNISLGASIMEAASDFVSSNLRVVLLPIMSYVVSVIFFVFWSIATVHLYSIGTAEADPNMPVANIKWDKQNWYIMWYMLFALFWVIAYIICLQQFIIAAMTCMWYFAGEGSDMATGEKDKASIWRAMKWGAWNHCGSVAFGAFIIALVTMIRVVFEYIVSKTEKLAGENPLIKTAIWCGRCYLYWLDQYVKFITKNAFIQVALHSKNFCSSAWAAFCLIIRNAGRFTSAGIIGWIIMMLGKGTIMAASTFLTMVIVQKGFPQVQQPFIPAAIILAVSYIVGSLFLSIFSFASTAIMHCFLLDEETNGNGANTPDSLKSFLDNYDEDKLEKANVDQEGGLQVPTKQSGKEELDTSNRMD